MPRRRRPRVKPAFPPLADQLHRYSVAVRRWIDLGRPVRSDAEVTRIYQECCVPCGWFSEEKKKCRKCGCAVRDSNDPGLVGYVLHALAGKVVDGFLNKLRMATEDCPLRPRRKRWRVPRELQASVEAWNVREAERVAKAKADHAARPQDPGQP